MTDRPTTAPSAGNVLRGAASDGPAFRGGPADHRGRASDARVPPLGRVLPHRQAAGEDPIRVLIADDHALFRRGLEMELVGHDFFLFHDSGCDKFSVVYRRRGYDYGVIRLVEE